MIRNTAGAILLAATLAAGALTQVTETRAASQYDGTWSMVVYTRSGPCDASYRFSGQIINGVINYGGPGVDIVGHVKSGGSAYARVSGSSAYAVASGHLTATRGGGTWHGRTSSGYCSGTWAASRSW